MDKCVRMAVALAITSHIVTGRSYIPDVRHKEPHRGYDYPVPHHHPPGRWHHDQDWDQSGSSSGSYGRPASYQKDHKPHKHPHHDKDWSPHDSHSSSSDWDSGSWEYPDYPGHGSPEWNHHGWGHGHGHGNQHQQWPQNPQWPPHQQWPQQQPDMDWSNRPTRDQQHPTNTGAINPQTSPRATTDASQDLLAQTVCIRSCPVTSEYNPVCGSNNVTYSNPGRLECAKFCGVDVNLARNSALKYVIHSALLVLLSSVNILAAQSCHDTSPQCLKEVLQSELPIFAEANPKIGISSLDPFVIDKLVLTLPGNLKMEFHHGQSKGFRNCVIDSARLIEDRVDRLNNTIDLQFHCNLTIKGRYKTAGSLLMFALNGNGQALIRCQNIKIQFIAKLGSKVAEDGKKHLEITAFKASHTFEGQVQYRLSNLIDKNPMLSSVVLQFMNSNWKLVAEEFGKPIVDYGISNVLKNLKILLKSIPQEELVGHVEGFIV
ncbi:hypothetical protein NE865_11038 [Phthorimaea operculella]|nr:hypothetical protein NE865_11038 [Phthorimaea operculella]